MITLINPWVGPLPAWFNQWRACVERFEPRVRFLTLQYPWEYFRDRIHDVTDVWAPRRLLLPYKLCDYRPAFGAIFERELEGSTWWGWYDMDAAYGDVDRFLTPERLEAHDVITVGDQMTGGAFTIFRRTPELRELFRLGPFRDAFSAHDHTGFDEICLPGGRKKLEMVSFTDVVRANVPADRVLYAPEWYGEDIQPGTAAMLDGRLFLDGRELLMYHCSLSRRKKRWPLA